MKRLPKSKWGPALASMALLFFSLGLSPVASFLVPAHTDATAPPLGMAANFAVLGGNRVTNTGSTVVTGDLGVDPGTAMTGFPPGSMSGTKHAADAVALKAQKDAAVAYVNAAGQPCTFKLTGQNLGGKNLITGVYCFKYSAQLTGQLTLNGLGNPASVFIFQVGSTLKTTSNASLLLTNGAQACNIFWQVGGSATIGKKTRFIGNILALSSISVNTGAMSTGSLYARNGVVTLDSNTITRSPCADLAPTASPSVSPSATPTESPSATPTESPTATPTESPTPTPTESPTPTPTATPIESPTPTPQPSPPGMPPTGSDPGNSAGPVP